MPKALPNITTDMVTIAAKGNGTDFGELSVKVFGMGLLQIVLKVFMVVDTHLLCSCC